MAFEPVRNYLFPAARTYKLAPQAVGGIVCAVARQVIAREYPDFVEQWEPVALESHTLTICTAHSAASAALHMHTQELLDHLAAEDIPTKVREIKIERKKS